MAAPVEKLRMLEQIERDIGSAIENAGWTLQELSKDKCNTKVVESYSNAFLKTVNSIEANLSKKINYLAQASTGQPHSGSSYGAHKDWQIAVNRFEHVKARLDEMEQMRYDPALSAIMSVNQPPPDAGSVSAATRVQQQQLARFTQ